VPPPSRAGSAALTSPPHRRSPTAAGPPAAPGTEPDPDAGSTRQRILDVALDLFIEQGFDKTPLRQIAEKLGFSKAALYYHFASKDDILMALHLRLHELGKESLTALGEAPSSPEAWAAMFDTFISVMMDNRKVFVLHERNQAAFENLHRQEHHAEHTDLEERIRAVLNDPSIAVEQRVRMACAMGAVMGGLVLAGDAFVDVSSLDLSTMLRSAINDVLGVGVGAPRAPAIPGSTRADAPSGTKRRARAKEPK
jgi:AcrR family transcriptional regulator